MEFKVLFLTWWTQW